MGTNAAYKQIRKANILIGRNVIAQTQHGAPWEWDDGEPIEFVEGCPTHEQTPPPDAKIAERCYFAYRDKSVPLIDSPDLFSHLEQRYECAALTLAEHVYPVAIIWQNEDETIQTDAVLGQLDATPPRPLTSSSIMDDVEYAEARRFIKTEFKRGPITWEGINYCMTHIDLTTDPPVIHGAYCWYYDQILRQYSVEWELKKALLETGSVNRLSRCGTMPLREAIEQVDTPVTVNGSGRPAAITVSTLFVFNRHDRFYCLLRRRSLDVGVSPGMHHVVPGGMFEASNIEDNWSVAMNVWRELLEEVYSYDDEIGQPDAEYIDQTSQTQPPYAY